MAEKTCLVVRHVDFEGLGLLCNLLRERNYDFRYAHATDSDISCNGFLKEDLVIVLGGPYGVYEADKYPFIKNEINCISARLESGKPLLGICLGAQMMAAALGAKVAFSGSKEVGWHEVTLTPAGKKSLLSPLEGQPILHWHGDNCEMPDGCTCLAYSDFCPVQAFQLKPHQLGLQFHMEVEAERIDRWLPSSRESLRLANLTEDDVRAQAKRHGEAARKVGNKILGAWLDSLENA
jgi:GMP synthase (glutamine-hydrolysing)